MLILDSVIHSSSLLRIFQFNVDTAEYGKTKWVPLNTLFSASFNNMGTSIKNLFKIIINNIFFMPHSLHIRYVQRV